RELGPRSPDVPGRDQIRRGAVGVELIALLLRRALRVLVLEGDEALALGREGRLAPESLLDELTVAHVIDGRRQLRREHLGRVPALDVLEGVRDVAQVTELVVEEALPDGAHPRV